MIEQPRSFEICGEAVYHGRRAWQSKLLTSSTRKQSQRKRKRRGNDHIISARHAFSDLWTSHKTLPLIGLQDHSQQDATLRTKPLNSGTFGGQSTSKLQQVSVTQKRMLLHLGMDISKGRKSVVGSIKQVGAEFRKIFGKGT